MPQEDLMQIPSLVLTVSGGQFCHTGFGQQDWSSEMGQGTWIWVAQAPQGAWYPI